MLIDQSVIDPGKTLKAIVNAFRRRISLEDNIQCAILTINDTGGAGATVTVTHNLGKVPRAYIANMDKASSIKDVSRATWSVTQMQVACSAANVKLILVVF